MTVSLPCVVMTLLSASRVTLLLDRPVLVVAAWGYAAVPNTGWLVTPELGWVMVPINVPAVS